MQLFLEDEVEMCAQKDVSELIIAVLDLAAEAAGTELAPDGCKLRFTTPSGDERKLNSKVPWDDLMQARSIRVKLSSGREPLAPAPARRAPTLADSAGLMD